MMKDSGKSQTPTLAAICNEILFSFEHHSEVPHGYAELQDVPLMVAAVHGLIVLHTQRMNALIDRFIFHTINS